MTFALSSLSSKARPTSYANAECTECIESVNDSGLQRSPNISKPHPHPTGTSYAATQLCSYAAWPLGLEIRTTTNSYPGGLRNMPVFTGTSQNAQNSLKNSCVFCFVFCFRFLLFVFLLFLPFPPSPSLSSPDPRAFFAELELERSNASVHFAMHRKNPAETAENQQSELSRVVTSCDIRKES